MTRTPPEKRPPNSRDDRFIPIEEVDLAQAEVLGEFAGDNAEPADSHFPVILDKRERPLARRISAEPVLEPLVTPSEAILKSRRPKVLRRPARRRVDAPRFSPVVGQVGPPLPMLFVGFLVLLALVL